MVIAESSAATGRMQGTMGVRMGDVSTEAVIVSTDLHN